MSADLVRYEPKSSIDLAPEAWGLAQRIARTDFVPTALRGKPEAVLAAMLTGHELGIGPMQALSKIHVIEGRPSMAAELMRALVLREGHELWIEESTSTRCTVGARRAGSERDTRVTWTLDDAKRANLAGKTNWRAYPRAMLLARATAEVCRSVFPDLLAGISYSSEELTDGDVVDAEDLGAATDAAKPPPAPAKRTARARKAVTRPGPAPAPEPAPKSQAEAPPLPGEDEDFDPTAPSTDDGQDDDVADAEIVDDYEGPDEDRSARTYSGVQIIAMKLAELGVTERPARLRLISSIVGREIASSKDLTDQEIRRVLDKLGENGYLPDPEVLAGNAPPVERPTRRRRIPEETTDERPQRPAPEQWTGGHWRDFLAERGVKAMELLKEAAKLAREQDQRAPGTLDDLAGSGIADVLVGFVEDLALERSGS
jgi:hypothetical protein